VVKDFHWETLRNNIGPIAFQYEDEKPRVSQLSQLSVKIRASKTSAFIDFSKKKWNEFGSDEGMQYQFLDENFGQLLAKEAVFGKAIGFFTVLAIFISCLGLFGLSAYTTELRTKEIGIRKALGATVTNIVVMLNTQFARLVLIAILIAFPLAMATADEWLDQFAYKTNVEIWIYVVGGLSALLICSLTVGFHSLKASKTNPAETLKSE
jgi:putative ABC transport system permease protein